MEGFSPMCPAMSTHVSAESTLLNTDANSYHDLHGQLWHPLHLTPVHQGPGKGWAETQAGSLESGLQIPCGR